MISRAQPSRDRETVSGPVRASWAPTFRGRPTITRFYRGCVLKETLWSPGVDSAGYCQQHIAVMGLSGAA
jgi:hypothetical protein